MKRLDSLVCQKLGVSREQAKEIITAGMVEVEGVPVLKPGAKFGLVGIKINAAKMPYVSRGGVKLAAALDHFGINPAGLDCIDIGASAGGFTDCLLQRGAGRIIALDNGTKQLAPTLAASPRVTSMENKDIRATKPQDLPFKPSFAVVDLSFISLSKVIPDIAMLLRPGSRALLLIKPQFEAGPGHADKRGIVRSLSVHADVLTSTINAVINSGFAPLGLMFSPIKGQGGNIEYFAYMEKL